MAASLKLPNELSVSAWYKASNLGLGTQTGEEIVSAGNNYLLRVRNNQVEFTKRVTGGFAQCIGAFNGSVDGNWHHVVGVTSATGMVLYVDGNQVLTNTRTENIIYDADADFVVGRHPTQTTWDFDGNIDDVRVYSRALTDADVLAIFQGPAVGDGRGPSLPAGPRLFVRWRCFPAPSGRSTATGPIHSLAVIWRWA